MLPNLLQIDQRIFKSSAYSRHATQGCSLERLALKERLRILQESDVVPRDSFDQSFCRRQSAKSDTEVVGIIESIEEVFVEGMDILEAWETVKNGLELFTERLRSEFNLASVETCRQSVSQSSSKTKAPAVTSYSADLKASTNLCGKFPLSSTKNNVDELLRSRNRRNLPLMVSTRQRIYDTQLSPLSTSSSSCIQVARLFLSDAGSSAFFSGGTNILEGLPKWKESRRQFFALISSILLGQYFCHFRVEALTKPLVSPSQLLFHQLWQFVLPVISDYKIH